MRRDRQGDGVNPYHRIKDFHADRLRGVGSSDVATLAGLNKRYSNRYAWTAKGALWPAGRPEGTEETLPQTVRTLWLEKTGRVVQVADPEKDERKEWGHELEPMVARKWIRRHYGDEAAMDYYRNATRAEPVSSGPFKVLTQAFHPERPYALAHADLLVDWNEEELQPHLVEIKTSGFMAGKRRDMDPGSGYSEDDRSQFGIPDKVFMQVQWQLWVYGIQEATVAVLIDTADYREYGPVIYDPRHVEKSLALAQAFWALVESDTEPAPSTWDDVVSSYPDLENKTAMVSGEAEMEARKIVAEGWELKARKKDIDERLDDIKMALGILVGDQKTEDGKIVRTMNRVLNASDGSTLAKFRDQTKDSLSLSAWLDEAEKKSKKYAAMMTKVAAGKEFSEDDWSAVKLTMDEAQALRLDAELRALGAYKTSEPFRVVTY